MFEGGNFSSTSLAAIFSFSNFDLPFLGELEIPEIMALTALLADVTVPDILLGGNRKLYLQNVFILGYLYQVRHFIEQ